MAGVDRAAVTRSPGPRPGSDPEVGRAREAVAAVWRIESARIVGALTRLTGDFALAEDLAQEALAEALVTWPRDGVPTNPAGWLLTVGRRRAIDAFRRRSALDERYAAMARDLPKASHDRISPEGLDAWRESFRIIQSHEIWKVYGDFVKTHNPNFGPGVKERFAFAATVTDQEVAKANDVRRRARERTASLVKSGTILALPTSPSIAPLTATSPEELDLFRTRALRMTSTAGLSGLPQVTIPIGTVAGCPAGLSFIGWRGGDEALLDLALAVSKYCGIET